MYCETDEITSKLNNF